MGSAKGKAYAGYEFGFPSAWFRCASRGIPNEGWLGDVGVLGVGEIFAVVVAGWGAEGGVVQDPHVVQSRVDREGFLPREDDWEALE